MWPPLTFCLLSALLTTGSALLCEVCESTDEICSGPLQPCAPWEDVCVINFGILSDGKMTNTFISKSCLEVTYCKSGQLTTTYGHNVTVQSNVLCCHTDGCNIGTIPAPSVSRVPNGRQCPSCFTIGADRCEDMEPLACTGIEDHCTDLAGTLQIGNIGLMHAAAGCSSPDFTVLRPGVMKFSKYVVGLYTRAEHYLAPRTGGDIKEP